MSSHVPSLSAPANVLIVGATGGIGSAFAALLRNDARVGQLHLTGRQPSRGNDLGAGATYWHQVDTDDESSLAALAGALHETPLDLVIVATGLLHEADLQPEKRLSDLDPRQMLRVLQRNTVGPAIAAKHLLPRLRTTGKTVFAALSARVGSISDNRLGGWVSYRASKAALNMTLATLAVEMRRTRPGAILLALHPGTVDTPLSQPFSARVPSARLFTPERSAVALLEVIDARTAADSGGFFAWDGQRIEY